MRNGAGLAVKSTAVTTGTAGSALVRLSLPWGTTYSITVTLVVATGRAWDGRTPSNSVTVS